MREFLEHNLFWRNTLRSALIHGVIVLALLLWSVVSCVKRRRPHEITTFVELQLEPAAPVPQSVPAPPEPEPEPAPPPPEPAVTIPEPEPVKPKPNQNRNQNRSRSQNLSQNRNENRRQPQTVRRDQPAKPAPALTQEQVRNLLAKGAKPVASSSDAGFGWYLLIVRDEMYKAWEQPSTLGGRKSGTTQITIRVRRNGLITERRLTRSSGNALMDQSAMQAAEAVTKLPELPPGFGSDYKDITVDFELTE